ncbi:NAD-dependent epimerase/dehydratase family protein [Actinobacteria bacterium YIM 96077]|uniref:NAD-dependent epimerase n=1 Tax=Phytoactinopolyspora halophila TaxID=1981511 RepID=A0A329QSH5_9ACTN|nr:NAD-dependent epimerase/dehydratase family protein [Phytoactinopolyspora halophila]AYY14876.1 NAD-dependent epimerase/dehydratase family protein [Actinobacteria bacterium YIM 96077]RAW15334.1 NAD-dependent epimerase [Phytoactinopolyspora halophila]
MPLHVIVGAGPVGTTLATTLADDGHDVRIVTRSGSGPQHQRIERVQADASDSTALRPLVKGAAALYNCANPPSYQHWARVWPPLAASLLDAAESASTVLVTMGNLYGYGPATEPITRDHPLNATDHKGTLRNAMWQDALAAHQAGRIRATEARASDFIGPGVQPEAGMSARYVKTALAGKTVYMFGDPDAEHSWSYIPDVARTLAVLGTDERAWGQAWHVPSPPPVSPRELVESASRAAGLQAPRIRRVPRNVLRLFHPFSGLLRELDGVLYQWERPFEIDATATTDTFGLTPAPWPEVIERTLEYWQSAHVRRGAGQRHQTS